MTTRRIDRRRRRMLHGHRRGRSSRSKLLYQRNRDLQRQEQKQEHIKASNLLVFQLNAGSIVNKLNLFRSKIYENKPDVVIVEEDWILDDKSPYQVDGYTWYHAARIQPRSNNLKIRGGGLSILIRTSNSNLFAQTLPTISLEEDNTTELLRIRLLWANAGGITTIDINNIYRPPIAYSAADIRECAFDAARLAPIFECDLHGSYEGGIHNSGILFCGDVNAHHPLWDSTTPVDKAGRSLAKLFNSHNVTVANDGSPTFYTKSAATAIDITAYKGEISVENWSANNPPLGSSHHCILSYNISSLIEDPLHIHVAHSVEQPTTTLSGINWKKVDWAKYCDTVHKTEQEFLERYLHNDSYDQVHIRAKAFYKGIEIANRDLPRGKSLDPVPWCTPELQQLLLERNVAWENCKGQSYSLKWEVWKTAAVKLEKKIHEETTKYWHDFCSSLEGNTDEISIDHVIAAMGGKVPNSSNDSFVLEDKINHKLTKNVTSNSGKARVFKKSYARIFKRPRPKTQQEKQQEHSLKQRVTNYINLADQQDSPDARPFNMKELKQAIRDIKLKKNKAPGVDGIHNQILIHASSPLQRSILDLTNSIWKTGTMPRNFLLSIIVPIHKEGKPPELPKSYRPIALTSCLSKLIERMVVRRLIYRIETHHIIAGYQSAFRPNRSTADPLMRLVANISQGFEATPAKRTLVAQLDLSKAYDKVNHLKLLDAFRQLAIPPVYARFYKGFLADRRFKVRWNGSLSKSGRQESGVPQGAVSSPVLYILYVEAALKQIIPAANAQNTQIHMYADDLTVWTTGYDIAKMSQSLTNFLNTSLVPVFNQIDQELNPDKCTSFVFTTHRHDAWPCIKIHNKILKSPKAIKSRSLSIRILGVFLIRN